MIPDACRSCPTLGVQLAIGRCELTAIAELKREVWQLEDDLAAAQALNVALLLWVLPTLVSKP